MTENEMSLFIQTESGESVTFDIVEDASEVKINTELSAMFLKGGFKELRRRSRLSQKDIAERTGLSLKTISSIENPMNTSNNPTLKSLIKYLSVFGAELEIKPKTI